MTIQLGRGSRKRNCVMAVCTSLSIAFASTSAHAGGLYFSDRGVRPLARGGAFVAGGDDLGAMWYNPAGIAEAGTSFLSDSAWLDYSASFTRRTRVVDAAGTVRVYDFPTVKSSAPFLPLPTLA